MPLHSELTTAASRLSCILNAIMPIPFTNVAGEFFLLDSGNRRWEGFGGLGGGFLLGINTRCQVFTAVNTEFPQTTVYSKKHHPTAQRQYILHLLILSLNNRFQHGIINGDRPSGPNALSMPRTWRQSNRLSLPCPTASSLEASSRIINIRRQTNTFCPPPRAPVSRRSAARRQASLRQFLGA